MDDWTIVMWLTLAVALWAIIWVLETRPTPHVFPPEWVCDGCGQVCSHLQDGLCEYCEKTYKPSVDKSRE